MTVSEFQITLRQLKEKKPFEPFSIELSNGSNLHIDHPDAIGFNNGSAAYIDAQGEVHFFNNAEHNATVVSRNLRDFSRIPGLATEDWSV